MPAKVSELALVKLFDRLEIDELVISMSALLAESSTDTALDSSLHDTTPHSRGSDTVSSSLSASSAGAVIMNFSHLTLDDVALEFMLLLCISGCH